MQSPDEPVEAYVMELASMKPVRVSAANIDLPKQPVGETRGDPLEIAKTARRSKDC